MIKDWVCQFANLQPVGRNGMHHYNNQDHSMMTAMLAARNIQGAQLRLLEGEHRGRIPRGRRQDGQRLEIIQGRIPLETRRKSAGRRSEGTHRKRCAQIGAVQIRPGHLFNYQRDRNQKLNLSTRDSMPAFYHETIDRILKTISEKGH